MATEVLGIQIKLDLSGLDTQIASLNSKIGNGIDASKFAKGFADGMTKAFKAIEQQAEQTKEKVSKVAKELANMYGGSGSDMQKAIAQANFNKQLADTTKLLDQYTNKIKDANGRLTTLSQLQKDLNSNMKGFSYLDPQDKSKGYTKSGVIKDVGIAQEQANLINASRNVAAAEKARALAHKEAEKAAKEAATANGTLSLSIKWMAERLTAFYAIRTVIFTLGNHAKEAVGSVLDLSQAVHDIAAIAGSDKDSLGNISDSIMTIARSSRYTIQEVSQLMQVLAQAGVSAKELPAVSEAVGRFATATGSKPDVAADVVTTALNVYGIRAEETTRVTNVLTAALNESKLTTEGLATAFNYLAPQAAQFGYSLEETAGIIATMSQAGIRPSTIGTGVSQLLKEFAAPKKRVINMLEYYGLTAEDVNPVKHSFDEIVNVLKDKGVEAEHLFKALESRVGRSIVTAVTLGGDAFKYMTESITGTNSALVAYEMAMEGARAKLNVLKMEFIKIFVDIGQGTSGLFVGITDALITMLKGFNSAHGHFALLAGAMLGMIRFLPSLINLVLGFNAALLANPYAMAAGIVIALGMAFWGLGKSLNKSEEALEANKKKMEETKELETVLIAVRKANSKELREIEKAEKLGAAGELTVNTLKSQKIKLTEDAREALNKYLKKHPELINGLIKEGDVLGTLIEKQRELNKLKETNEKTNLSTYNMARNKREVIESQLAEVEGTKTNANKNESPLANFLFKSYSKMQLKDALAQAKKDEADAASMVNWGNAKVTKSGVVVWNKAESDKREPAENVDFNSNGSKPKNIQKALDEVTEYVDKQLASYTISELKDKAAILKDKIKDTKDHTEYEQSVKQYSQVLDQVAAKEIEAKELEIKQQIASKMGGEYNSKSNTYSWADDKASENKANYLKLKDKFDAQTARDLAAFKGKAASDKEKDIATLPEFKGEKFSSAKLIKEEDYRMKQVQQRLALEKEQVWTAEQARQVDIQASRESTLSNEKKLGYLTQEYNQFDELRKQGKLTKDEDKAKYEQLASDIQTINELLAEQRRKTDELGNTNFWDNFTKGAKAGMVAMGDFKSNTQALGQQVTDTFMNGMVNSIDTMLTSIENGKKGWKSFKDAFGNVLQDMGAMIQKFVVKLMVLYLWEKLVGFAVGSSIGSTTNSLPSTQNIGGSLSTTNNWDTGATGGFVRGAGLGIGSNKSIRLFADGGSIPLGIGTPGVDSVPALLMPGEYVVRSSSVNAIGIDRLEHMNKTGRLPRFANGGSVGGGRGSGASDQTVGNLTIINVADVNSIPAQPVDANQIINIVSFDVNKRGVLHAAIKGINNR